MERLRHCVIDHGSSSWLQCEVSKYSYTFGDPKYRSAPMIVPPMVEGLWVFETVVFVCFSTCVLWPLKTATWVLRFIKVCKPWGVQLHFQLLTALAKVSQLKRVSQISSLSEAVVTHLLYNYLVSTPQTQNILSLYAFLNIITENIKNQEVGSLALEHCKFNCIPKVWRTYIHIYIHTHTTLAAVYGHYLQSNASR